MNHSPEEFEVDGRPFMTMYPGNCTVDYEHIIKRGERVARVRRADNPMLPVSGVACYRCIRLMMTARR